MHIFKDINGNMVHFISEPANFSEKIEHVLTICSYHDHWLLTNHRTRGLEFPGGKVEGNESLEAAACREVWEETGATINNLVAIGSYKVEDPKGTFFKKVFLGFVDEIEVKDNYLETNGPVLVKKEHLPKERFNDSYSFIMKDMLIELCFSSIKEKVEGVI